MRHSSASDNVARQGLPMGAFRSDLPIDSLPSGTKGRILSSALVAFAERGFYGTSIRTIADGVGINSATLYSHFSSKEQILAALVAIGSRALLTRLESELAPASTSAERLDALVRATVIAHATFPLLATVTNNEVYALSAKLAEQSLAPTVAAAALLRDVIREGVSDGSFALAAPTVTAHVIEGMAQQIPRWMNPATDDPEHLADAYAIVARRLVGIH